MKQHRYTLAQYTMVLIMLANLSCFAAAWIVDGRMRATASLLKPDPATGRIALLEARKPVAGYVQKSDIALFNALVIGGFSCLALNIAIALASGMFGKDGEG